MLYGCSKPIETFALISQPSLLPTPKLLYDSKWLLMFQPQHCIPYSRKSEEGSKGKKGHSFLLGEPQEV